MFNLFKCKTDIKPHPMIPPPKTIDEKIIETATLKRLKADLNRKAKEDFQKRVASLLNSSRYVRVELVNDEVRVFYKGQADFYLRMEGGTQDYFRYGYPNTWVSFLELGDDKILKLVADFIVEHCGPIEELT